MAPTNVPLFGCAICGRRRPAEEYPLDEDNDVRLVATCADCLEQNGINQHRRGLLDQLDLNLEDLAGSQGTEKKTTTKRKRSSLRLPTVAPRKRTKIVRPAPPPKTVTCTICFEDKGGFDFPAKPPGPKSRSKTTYKDAPIFCAAHLHYTSKTPVCKECISNSLTAAVDLKDAEKLGCPTEACNAVWEQQYLQQYLTPEAFNHYSEVLLQQFLASRSFFYCIDPKCAQGGLNEIPHGYPNLECGACKKRACAICKVEWHRGMTCQEYREEHGESKDEDELQVLRRMAKRGAKRCSNCQLAVEKEGGCDYMWCPHCRQQFYWASAEPVRAPTKTTRNSSSKKSPSKAPPAPPFPNPLYRPCEVDAAAARAKAGQPAFPPVPPPPGPPDPRFLPQGNIIPLALGLHADNEFL